MSSDDEDTPVANAHDNPTNLNLHDSLDAGVNNFVDNYDLMMRGEEGNFEKYSLSEQMVHFCGGIISRVHWTACKAVLAHYAGSSTSKLSQMTKKLREAACLRIYMNAVDELDDEHFDADAKVFFKKSFLKTSEPLHPGSLYRYYLDSRCKVRNHLLPLFPKDLVKMKSGHGFHETCNKVYITGYRHEMASLLKKGIPRYTKQEVAQMLPPPNWEYSKSPWYFGLVVKIFRRDPQLALDVADVMTDLSNVPLSRAEMKRRKQQDGQFGSAKKKASTSVTDASSLSADADHYPSVVSSTNVDNRAASVMAMATENQERLASAKMLSSKAQAGTYNIGVRLAVMEELERGLTVLDRIRGTIGEERYSDGVNHVYGSLPKYGTFKDEVKVIDVDMNDPPPGSASFGVVASSSTATKDANDNGTVDSDDDDDFDDDDGQTDLQAMFPNTEDSNVEYIYTRNASGRVISVDCRLKKGKKQTT